MVARRDASIARLLLAGGVIRTMDGATARSITVEGDRIAALDRDGSPEVDLDGACVLPGFTDSHVHFPSWAASLEQIELHGVSSLAEALALVRAAVAGLPEGIWVRGFGWRDADWEAAPTTADLDEVAGDRPVALLSHDYHSLWCSSAALALAQEPLERPGGVVEPTGILREESAWQFRDRYALPSPEELLAAMRSALPVAAAAGVTAIHDKDGWIGALDLFRALDSEGRLTLRVWQSHPASDMDTLPDRVDEGMVRTGYVKAFMDGTLGSRTARLLDGSGIAITSREDFEDIVRRAARAGWPVAVHAIGDLANREALDAFEASREEWEPRGLRQRIEHLQCVDPADRPRFGALGIAGSIQFSHAPSDRDLVERFWAERASSAYAFRSLLEAGTLLCAGSDAPVEPLRPLEGLRAAVLRTLDDRPGWRMDEAVTMQAALEAYTVNPAWLACEEDRRGRLRPGFLADLTVLSGDPLTTPADSLEIVATMVGGRWIHGPWVS
jgi:predicted amidohydrolase YtcJ